MMKLKKPSAFSSISYNTMALFFACVNNNLTSIKKYLDVNKTNRRGETPLCRASSYGRNDAVKFLLEANADVNKTDINGNTPLICASTYSFNGQHNDIVRTLLEGNADVNIQNNDGKTCFDVANPDTLNVINEVLKELGKDKKRAKAYREIDYRALCS